MDPARHSRTLDTHATPYMAEMTLKASQPNEVNTACEAKLMVPTGNVMDHHAFENLAHPLYTQALQARKVQKKENPRRNKAGNNEI